MSSSRIIKGKGGGERPVAAFFFETLSYGALAAPDVAEEDFRPFFPESPVPATEAMAAVASASSLQAQSPDGLAKAVPAPDELEALLREAYDNGFAAGRGEAEEFFTGVCRAFSAAIVEVSGLRERIVRESEDDLLRLAVMVAKQIIQQEVSQDRKILAHFVDEAVRGVADQGEIVVCFNPEDYRIIAANRHLYLAGVADQGHLTIKSDDSVPVCGCVVEAPTGLVDASVEAQVAEIFLHLMQERGQMHDDPATLVIETESYVAEQYGAEKYDYKRH